METTKRLLPIALTLALASLPALAVAASDGGSIAGAFQVNNVLPADSVLVATVALEDGDEPLATKTVQQADGAVAFSFDGLASGDYRIELVAQRAGGALLLAALEGVQLEPDAPAVADLSADAIGVDGEASGTITLHGTPPADRLLLVRADRTDITLPSPMPDALNRLSFEPSKEEIAAGSLDYEFEGMSYGVYRIELIGYDYKTHRVESYGALPELVTLDARERSRWDLDFEVTLGSE